ncbi:MAG: GTPase Era [Desulfobulbaceae bacterium]|nr:GTPase Era [Desulfobulbaceae bacterium]
MTEPQTPEKKTDATPYRSGVIAIIGPPNAGKSTLLNHFLGQKIAIVTPKPQTTRNRILGILNGESYQIILLDTPGLHKPRELLNREMVRIALDTLAEADVVLFLADAQVNKPEKLEKLGNEFAEYLRQVTCPVVLALNKVDRLDKTQLLPLMEWYADFYPFAAVLPISALHGDGADLLVDELVRLLPEGPQYYPDDIPTDATERFIAAEIIREKVFLLTREEVPYSTAVMIDSFQESVDNRPVVIHATILVEQPSQKGIIIGRKGAMLAEIRKKAVLEIARMLDQRVSLRLWVKVKKKWTSNEQILRELGLSKS